MKGHSVAAEWQYLDELCHFNVLQSIISSLWNHLQQIGNVTDLTRSGRPPQRNDHHLLVTNALRDKIQNATQLQQQLFHAAGSLFVIIIYPLTARVVGAPQMTSQPVFSIFPCSPLPPGTCRTPGLSIP